jgi:peptidoglycan/LPS O-acetylase OafA/YrhL
VGVDLFFVLSGFLISGLLFAELRTHGTISPLRFYARRAWKIYPPYFVMLAVSLVVIPLFGGEYTRLQVAAEVLFFQNYVRGIWHHTWSLAVEEHFYLLLPLVCLLAVRVRGRGRSSPWLLLVVGLAVSVYALVARIDNTVAHMNFSQLTHVSPTHLRLDSLFFGVMLSYGYHFHAERFVGGLRPWRLPLIAAGCLLLVPAFLIPLEKSALMNTIGFTVMYLGSGMLLMGALLCEPRRGRVLGALGGLGATSYSIYLWHMPVLLFAVQQLAWLAGASVPFAAYVGGSLAVGALMARLVETPALRLRDRLVPSRARAMRAPRLTQATEAPASVPAVA